MKPTLALLVKALFLLPAAFFGACSLDMEPEAPRETLRESLPVDSLAFLPPGRRFVLPGREVEVGIFGYAKGSSCSSFDTLGLLPAVSPSDSAGLVLVPRVRLRYRSGGHCRLDHHAQDTTLVHLLQVPPGRRPSRVTLAGPDGRPRSAARLLRENETERISSLLFLPDSAGRDSAAGRVLSRRAGGYFLRLLQPGCDSLNYGIVTVNGDSVRVTLSTVEFPAAGEGPVSPLPGASAPPGAEGAAPLNPVGATCSDSLSWAEIRLHPPFSRPAR